jgi:hypothetical protein
VRRNHLEHIIRAAAEVAHDDEIVVIGSQAILAAFPDAPPALLVSQDADVYPRNRPERATAVDGNLGDGSMFHETYGYFAHGVGPETPRAPEGWEARLVELRVEVGKGRFVTGWCMEPHDVVLSKCAAKRERDWDYAETAIRAGLVQTGELTRRVATLPLAERELAIVTGMLAGIVERVGA